MTILQPRCQGCGKYVSAEPGLDHTGESVVELIASGESPLYACDQCNPKEEQVEE